MTHEELLAEATWQLAPERCSDWHPVTFRTTSPQGNTAIGDFGDAGRLVEQLTEALRDKLDRMRRYEAALQRIAESDEQAHPLVRVALEALNPTA